MKILTGSIFLLLLGLIGAQLFRLNVQRVTLVSRAKELEQEASRIKGERDKVRADISYFSNPQNLAKEFLSSFPAKRSADEERYIIVPTKPQ